MAEHLLSTAVHETMPGKYVRPESQRPRLAEVVADARIPVVDLASPDRAAVVSAIGAACRSHGFFQVLNHGIDARLMLKVMAVAREFFMLPAEEKAKLYSDDPARKMRLSTSSNVRTETVHNWRDYLRLHCYPLDHQFVPDWPSNPAPFKEIMSTYCREVRELGFRLYGAISLSLGLEEGYIKKTLGEQEQHMAVNFYPRCPEPELTYGLPAHTDPNALTILLMDGEVAGLQVLKDGKWIAVNPQPGALVINIGDQLQALSNGEYRSVWHRAVVNSDRERMSVASFLCPSNSVVLGPAEKLITEESPAVYRNYTYDEYYKKFWSRSLDQEHCNRIAVNPQPGALVINIGDHLQPPADNPVPLPGGRDSETDEQEKLNQFLKANLGFILNMVFGASLAGVPTQTRNTPIAKAASFLLYLAFITSMVALVKDQLTIVKNSLRWIYNIFILLIAVSGTLMMVMAVFGQDSTA